MHSLLFYSFTSAEPQSTTLHTGLFNRSCSCAYCAWSYKCWQSEPCNDLSDCRHDTHSGYFWISPPFFLPTPFFSNIYPPFNVPKYMDHLFIRWNGPNTPQIDVELLNTTITRLIKMTNSQSFIDVSKIWMFLFFFIKCTAINFCHKFKKQFDCFESVI